MGRDPRPTERDLLWDGVKILHEVVTQFEWLTEQEMTVALAAGRTARIPLPRAPLGPRETLEVIIDASIGTGLPHYVMFSGGRDSSAILALCTILARARRADDPVPVTIRHPGIEESDEQLWQEMVLRHLGIRRHEILEFHGEQSLLGAAAQCAMRRRGVVWPSALQLREPVYTQLDHGVVVTGEGGDHIINAHRITPLRNLVFRRSRPSRALLALSADSLKPLFLQRRQAASYVSPWLRGEAASFLRRAIADVIVEPLSFSRATWEMFDSRAQSVTLTNLNIAIREFGLIPLNPFAHIDFRAAVATSGGFWGFKGRTHMMRILFSDLLPDAVLSRTSKASFNVARWGEDTREFARSWDGSGFDERLVDVERLRQEWLTDLPGPGADYLLQLAWARGEGIKTPVAA